MRQVAGLGAGALHHVGVLGQHVVELGHQRLQLLRERPLQLRGGAGAHGGQPLAQQLQGAQRKLQLQHHGQRQAGGQHAQGDEQHAGEALQRLGQQGLVARHHQAQGRGGIVGQLQRARHGQQPVALGVLQRKHAVAPGGVALGRGRQGQRLVPQRARARHGRARLVAQAVDLPVQARQRLLQARVGHHGGRDEPPVRPPVHHGAELVELQHQLRLQLLRDVVQEQGAQPPAGGGDAEQHPGQRAGQQSQPQRAALHAPPSTSTSR